jgi:hypothetical protein
MRHTTQIYSNPKREHDPHALPDAEVFYITQKAIDRARGDSVFSSKGWYYWYCFPGCLPDSDEPNGPFDTEDDAIADLRSNAAEDDDEHAFQPSENPLYCAICGASETDHRE